VPLDLLETFIAVVQCDGDATRAATALDINQPSMSKRLATLRRLTAERTGNPWLLRQGKRWRVTDEGQRVKPVVSELVARYAQLERFVASGSEGADSVALACGQQAASSFVREAIVRFHGERPTDRVRLLTPRGRARIEGVAAGQFDLACVTDPPAVIRQLARSELFIEPLMEDRFFLAACPPAGSAWGKRWKKLSEDRAVAASELVDLPFVLPEPDAARRRQFDDWASRATGRMLNVVLEIGGWQTMLDFVAQGLGIGLIPETALTIYAARSRVKLSSRRLSEEDFPPDHVRLIARKAHGHDAPDLSPPASRLRELLLGAAAGRQ
jgi:DNA-binding transcriptional LysR family regulator